ncbi:MAG: hypothetical protein KF832_19450 [Caldilineaceae bacterium]|nr:hypothetical protein [Caldilineaceae bacterium]
MSANLTSETIIPLLPCTSYTETVAFYRALGFTITHAQEQPYLYLAVSRGGIHLHFTGSLGVYQAKNPFGACLVFVPDVNPVHQAFADGLRRAYGKVPTAKLPRLSRPQLDQTRFKLFDPTGNVLIFINDDEPEITYGAFDESRSAAEKALDKASFLRDTYANDKAAARVLDLALARDKAALSSDRARLLAARAELAVAMGEEDRAAAIQHELQEIALSGAERAQFQHELEAAATVARWIKQG